MKKILLSVVALLGAATIYAQKTYVSVSGGYGFPSSQKVLGKDASDPNTITDLKGSYGEGLQAQLRGGYYFYNNLAVELALGYLHGNNVQTNKNKFVDMKAHGRAFGASLSLVYDITDNLYVRAGAVTKIGGKTAVKTSLNANLPMNMFVPLAPPNAVIGLNTEFESSFHGKMPFGFIGGVGYRFELTKNVSLFVEGEYLNINVPRKESKLENFKASHTIWGVNTSISVDEFKNYVRLLQALPAGNERLAAYKQLANQMAPLLESSYDWEGKGAPDAPYSSIGLNVGITYRF